MRDENLSPKQIQAKVAELRADTIARVKAALTPEQKEKYGLARKEVKATKKKRMRENRKNRLGPQPVPPVRQPAK